MPALTPLNRRDWLTLLLIVFAAALLRLGEPGIVEFKHDEAWLSLKALEMIDGTQPAFTGIPSSVGIPNPPISVYVMLPPYLFTTNPIIATLYVAALNVIGVGLLWLLARRYLGRRVALVAGLTYACSPWAVYYSRKIWAQDMHTPLLLLALLLGLIGFVEGRRWAQLLCLPLLLFALQIHFAAWALLPLYSWLVWTGFQRQTLSWQALLLSMALAALVLVPYGIGIAQTLERDPDALNNGIGQDDRPFGVAINAALHTAQLATGLGLETWLAPDDADALLASVPAPAGLWLLLGGLALTGIVFVWLQPYRPLAGLIVLWALLPLLIFTPGWTNIYPHYFIAGLPAYALLTAISADWLMRSIPGQPFSRTVILAAVCALLLSQALWWRGVLRYVDAVYAADGFGTPVYRLMPLRDALLESDDVVLLADDDRLRYSETPLIWSVMLHDRARCVRTLGQPTLQLFPAQGFTAVFAPDASDNPTFERYRTGEPIVFDAPAGAYQVYRHDQPLEPPSLTPLEALRFANAVNFVGYAIEADEMHLLWQLPARQPVDYHFFVHLLAASGERSAQQDAPFLQGRFWCAGDRLLTTVRLASLNAATLRVGMYELVGDRFINVPLVDSAGQPGTPWADIPLESEQP